ncbi:mechanosensitive channel MscK [Pseudomonas neustonica]|uniref:Mechanosensitive channel MscK n=1 Tax=Pseudomonas neustonica TaxID=2487346 RepID=A0ABX9XJ22_9PSED|nr:MULTISPECIES: mechanosensitive channel MscK [Pseudomonas]ROZ83561.1 mechanosensitive channel MscK [Pseudomonas sp. SSM44]ROZ85419.1 mechanosensitive channel MscK [Pseudomonas neustonica]
MLRFLSSIMLCLFLSTGVLAQETPTPDDLSERIDNVNASIETLNNSSLAEPDKRELNDLYQSTLNYLKQGLQAKEDQNNLQQEISNAPRETQSIRAKHNQLAKRDTSGGARKDNFQALSLHELETKLADQVNQMFTWQNELTAVNGELIAAQTRPERTQASVSENQKRAQAVADQLRSLQRQPPTQQSRARIDMLQAERDYLQLTNDLLRQKLSGNNALQDLATQKKNLLSLQIRQIEDDIKVLQDVINEKRQSQSEKTVSDATLPEQATQNQVLQQQSSINRGLSEELLSATSEIGDLTRRNIETKQQTEHLSQVDKALEQQIDVLEGSLLLSRILHQQKNALPKVNIDSRIADQIADLRLRQFELNQHSDELSNPDAYLNNLLLQIPVRQRDTLRPGLEQMVNSRVTLVEQLNNNINTLINLAISLQINQRQLQQLSNDLQRTIDDQLFWVASSRPLDKNWVLDFPAQAKRQVESLHLKQVAENVLSTLKKHYPWVGGFVIFLGLYFWRKPSMRRRLNTLNDEVGHFRRDSPWHTPRALVLTLLLISPIPIALMNLGLIMHLGHEAAMPSLGLALLKLSLAWVVLHLLYRVLDPRGIAVRHFHWDDKLVQRLHVLTRRLAWILMPLVLVFGLHGSLPEQMGGDALGRAIMLLGMFLLAGLLGRIMWRSEPLYDSRVLHFSATVVLIIAPLALAGLTAWGYHYTAVKLAERFIDSLYLIVLWMLVEGTVVRNLNVAGRRLAYQRAVAKRQAAEAREGQDSEVPSVEVPEMNIQQINQQSLRLAKLALVILFTVALYFTWADLISAASYLESVTLWQYSGDGVTAGEAVPISAGDILGALITLILTFTLARNLPGLLEILVLSRMELRQGTSYAVTTLLSYVIVGFGLVSALSSLGVSWDKLQWLVAALGVGLGFGLQEIFANFISGLIILFERPVRIGDVVTIGPLSGTINRIRIRATTITDFDNKEIIVPNKNFVTEQIINWSLQDTITRVIIKVGVAYGSDVAKVRQLLMQIAANNARVLKDPEPMVLFLNFSDSTLDHELRVHVKELADRNQATDEINREIDRLFKENGIEIAFRQLDINLRDSKGLEKLVHSYRIDEPADQSSKALPTSRPDPDPQTPSDRADDEPGDGSPPM